MTPASPKQGGIIADRSRDGAQAANLTHHASSPLR